MTPGGLRALRCELEELTTAKRAELAQRLRDAKADGDIMKNAMYDAARDEQSFVEKRVSEIEHILRHAVVISHSSKHAVGLGSKVKVETEEGEVEYVIVGSTEANPEKGFISDQSPIGKALMGKKKGDELEVEVPAGTAKYRVKGIA